MSVGTIHITGQIDRTSGQPLLQIYFGERSLHSIPYKPGGGHHVRAALESLTRCNASHPALTTEQFSRVKTYLRLVNNGGCSFADEEDLGLILNEPEGNA
ncbi:hypothetical protein CMO91_00665 [Candidatus Woesearchaeota archaeon]|nr:hypothetical protein [Candidatus Woesearchaeota archaeon]